MPEPAEPLIGRDADSTAVARALDAVRSGRGGSVLLVGDAGIGKTSLVEDAVRRAAAEGFRVLRARGVRSGSDLPFGSLHEVLHPLLGLTDTLPERQRAALAVAFGDQQGPAPDRLVLGVTALALVEEAAATGPVLLVVDDLHWVDRSSGDTIAFLASRIGAVPAVLLGTSRGGPGHPDRSPVFDTVLHLEPLDDDDAEALVRRTAGELDATTRRRIVQDSHGNPLALRELANAAEGHEGGQSTGALPGRLARTFLAEVRNMPADTQRALLVAAAGEDATVHEIVESLRATGLPDDALSVAERAGIVRLDADRYRFRHPLIASSLYDDADSSTLRGVHRVLAGHLRDPASSALHRAAATAGWDESVARDLDTVAEAALRRGAGAEASAAWRRAAALSPEVAGQADRLVRAAEAARQAGASADAASLLDRAKGIAPLAGPDTRHRFARAEWMLSMTADFRGRSADELVDVVPDLDDPVRRAEVLLWAAAKVYIHQEPQRVRARVAVAVRAEETSDDVLGQVALALVDTGRELQDDTVERFLAQARSTDGVLINCLAFAAEEAGNTVASDRCWSAGARLFHDASRTSDETTALCGRASPRITAGHLRAGLADAAQSYRLSEELDLPVVGAMALAEVARGEARRGDLAAARSALRELEAFAAATAFARVAATSAWAEGIIAIEEGRFEDALADFARTGANQPVALWAGADMVDAAIRVGDLTAATAWVGRAGAVAETTGSAHLRMLVERSLGQLTADDHAAVAHFEAAISAGAGTDGPFDLGRAHLYLGERLRRMRRIVDARDHLTTAAGLLGSIGASSWAERARSELRATGGGTPDLLPSGDPSGLLTAQELLVSRLAATGRTNKEIADEVYLSHRTVAAHLSRAFSKLGISRRSQLAAVLPTETDGAVA